ncbi:MAG: PIG-L family deacetylase [Nitrospirota bacterium]|nr:PIG-L family deacetylase [Nitrospirota bacterium]MDH5769163.1 PIG-L family deacetylase [Nitrospirota bacterium]
MARNESDLYPYSVTDLSPKDALVIAPHPDDESLGCGGSIVKHIKAGNRVKVIFLTDGDQGDFEGRFGGNYVSMRKQSAHKAMEILGVQDYEFWGYKDRNLHLSEKEVTDRLRHTIETFSPSLIYVPSPFEAHPDHRTSFKIVWELRKKVSITVALYEVLMALYPNVLVDMTDEMEQKKRAIESYVTEVFYNDYVMKVEGLNRFRTATLPKNIKYAEAFVLSENSSHFEDSLPLKFLSIVSQT